MRLLRLRANGRWTIEYFVFPTDRKLLPRHPHEEKRRENKINLPESKHGLSKPLPPLSTAPDDAAAFVCRPPSAKANNNN
jgi:hypothetical protein